MTVKYANALAWCWLSLSLGLTFFVGLYAWQIRRDHLDAHLKLAVLEDVIDKAPIGIATADLTTGMSTFRNQHFVAVTGWTVTDLNKAGGPTIHYLNPEQWNRLRLLAKDGKIFDEDVDLRRPDGRKMDFRLLAIPVKADPTVIIGFFRENPREPLISR